MINKDNELVYTNYKDFHIKDGGEAPEEYALTELVKNAIIHKYYKIYYGGGYEYRTEEPIKRFDVVCYFTLFGDPYFMVCLDNSEGDCVYLTRCNNKAEIESITV